MVHPKRGIAIGSAMRWLLLGHQVADGPFYVRPCWGATTASKGALYGVGTCAPLRRRTGASRSSKGPVNHGGGDFCAHAAGGKGLIGDQQAARPVNGFEHCGRCRGGMYVRGSMTSTEMPSPDRASATCSVSGTIVVKATTVRVLAAAADGSLAKGDGGTLLLVLHRGC